MSKSNGVVIYDRDSGRYYGGVGWFKDISDALILTTKKSLNAKYKYLITHELYLRNHGINASNLCFRNVEVIVKDEYETIEEAIKGVDLC